jgi:hypothetical protein
VISLCTSVNYESLATLRFDCSLLCRNWHTGIATPIFLLRPNSGGVFKFDVICGSTQELAELITNAAFWTTTILPPWISVGQVF